MECAILFLQCVALYILVTIAATLEQRKSSARNPKMRWAVHVVRDTDANNTLSVILKHTGALIKWNSDLHHAVMQASKKHMTQNLLAGKSLRSHDGDEIEFVRVVHDGVDDEHMQQVLEQHSCDIVSVDTDGPDPVVILDDMHALLGVLLSRHNIIPWSAPACNHTHPLTPPVQSPRHTPRRRSKTAGAKTQQDGDP